MSGITTRSLSKGVNARILFRSEFFPYMNVSCKRDLFHIELQIYDGWMKWLYLTFSPLRIAGPSSLAYGLSGEGPLFRAWHVLSYGKIPFLLCLREN